MATAGRCSEANHGLRYRRRPLSQQEIAIGLREAFVQRKRLRSLLRAPPGIFVDAGKVLILGAVYYVAARLSLRLALIEMNVTPLWPPRASRS